MSSHVEALIDELTATYMELQEKRNRVHVEAAALLAQEKDLDEQLRALTAGMDALELVYKATEIATPTPGEQP